MCMDHSHAPMPLEGTRQVLEAPQLTQAPQAGSAAHSWQQSWGLVTFCFCTAKPSGPSRSPPLYSYLGGWGGVCVGGRGVAQQGQQA